MPALFSRQGDPCSLARLPEDIDEKQPQFVFREAFGPAASLLPDHEGWFYQFQLRLARGKNLCRHLGLRG